MAILESAVQEFNKYLSGFNLPVYDENTVPEEASLPRITYSWAEGEIGYDVPITVSLWYRSASWRDITVKALEIYNALGYGGETLKTDDGYMWIKRGSPFSSRMTDVQPDIRRIVINFTVEFLRG